MSPQRQTIKDYYNWIDFLTSRLALKYNLDPSDFTLEWEGDEKCRAMLGENILVEFQLDGEGIGQLSIYADIPVEVFL